jgi:hypothetical protein
MKAGQLSRSARAAPLRLRYKEGFQQKDEQPSNPLKMSIAGSGKAVGLDEVLSVKEKTTHQPPLERWPLMSFLGGHGE